MDATEWVKIDPTTGEGVVTTPKPPALGCNMNQLRLWIDIQALVVLLHHFNVRDSVILQHYVRLCQHYEASYGSDA